MRVIANSAPVRIPAGVVEGTRSGLNSRVDVREDGEWIKASKVPAFYVGAALKAAVNPTKKK